MQTQDELLHYTGQLKLISTSSLWRPETPISLHRFYGHMIRGALGHSLRAIACTRPGELCRDCARRHTCPASRIFEPYAPLSDGPVPGPRDKWPVPFAFKLTAWDPEADSRPTNRPLQVEWTLLGQALQYLSQFASAVELAGTTGFGNRRVRALTEWPEERPNSTDARLLSEVLAERIGQLASSTEGGVRVHLTTPLRLTSDGRARDKFALSPLLFAVARRLRLLCRADGVAEPSEMPPPREETDRQIRMSEALSWYDTEHDSQRQQKRYPIGGFIGHVDLLGPMDQILPWLVAGEILHVGKATSAGFGGIELTPIP